MRLSFMTSLKACATKKDLYQGSKLHADIRASGLLGKDTHLQSMLVSMYAKCGAFARAQQVVDELPVQDAVSWTALIAGYVQHGLGKEALCCFYRMQREGLSPNAFTYACILKACGIMQDIDMGKKIHHEIVSQGLMAKNVVLGNALVDMYARCGALTKAHEVLDGLPIRDVISWTILISGYNQHGDGKEALGCYHRMQSEGLSPNAITYVCLLKACGIMQDVDTGKQIHDEIVSQRLLDKNMVLCGALIDMYAKCGALLKAQKFSDELPIRNVISWTALIVGYVEHGHGKEALVCFHRMQSEGLSPNAFTYSCILKACGIIQNVEMGKQIHDEILSQRLLEKNIVVCGALIDMYTKCGELLQAQKVFNELPVRNVISWNALIAGYAQQGMGQETLCCFHRMRNEGSSPNAITYACILKACGIVQDIDTGKQMHDEIHSKGLLRRDGVLCGALVDMYVNCGALLKAKEVFDELPLRNVVSWNVLIAGYARQDQGKEALSCFQRMRSEGFSPTEITFACTLKACGIMQDVDVGTQIHEEIVSQGLLTKNVILGNALVDMYAKCGVLLKAQKVFNELPIRDATSWNSLIAGYAQQGQRQEAMSCFQHMWSEGLSPDIVSWTALIGAFVQQGLAKEALDCYHWMQQEGISPDEITFLNVLSACSHSGLVDEGQMYFDDMRSKYGIEPNKEHYTCMVDLFGRARLFDKAMRVIMTMPSSDYAPVWCVLLGACQRWGNLKLGRFTFERAVQVDQSNAAAYVLMSDMYAAAGMHEEAENIRRMRIKNAAWKQPGCPCLVGASEVENTKHPQSRQIYDKLQNVELKLPQPLHSSHLEWVSQNLSADSQKVLPCEQSEKLVVA